MNAVTIYKYKLSYEPVQIVHMQAHHRIIKVAEQGNSLVMWAEIDKSHAEMTDVEIFIYGTGWEMTDTYTKEYLDSVITSDGFVWHVYRTRS